MTQTTPTRDEAVPERSRIEPLLKDGDVVERLKQFRLRWQENGDLTYLGKALVDAIVEIEALAKERDEARKSWQEAADALTMESNRIDALLPMLAKVEALASAPAPASGRVDAVAPVGVDLVAAINHAESELSQHIEKYHDYEDDTPERASLRGIQHHLMGSLIADDGSALSPAATPVSAAEPVTAVAAEELAIKIVLLSVNWLRDSASEKEHEDYVRANWTKEIAEAKRLILAALAKPAYSPAPVRPIGNQGISDYQREIARNMAEGFAAWNAARQEALPSDEPASSPAGGDAAKVLASMAGGKPEDYAGMIKPDIFPSADEAARILRDRDACRSNLADAWAAMQMIREAVETLGPIGAMPAEEHLAGPTFLHEAEAIVAGIMKMKADK